MELRWLDDFCALARTRHFSKAADERHVSQPTFSRRIKLLEEEMGMTLIDRNTMPLSLTPAGQLFLSSCEDISQRLRQTKSQCQAIAQQQHDKLNFTTSQSLYLSFFPNWQQSVERDSGLSQPFEVNLQSSNWLGWEFVDALLQGESDLMLCYWHPAMTIDHDLEGEETDYLVLAKDNLLPMSAPLAEAIPNFNSDAVAQIKPKYQLPDSDAVVRGSLPFIAYHQKTFLAQVINAQIHTLAPRYLVTVNENSQAVSSKAMIVQGFGIGWLPQSLAQHEIDAGTLCIAGDHNWHIPLQIRLYRRTNNLNTNLLRLWEFLQAVSHH